MTNSTNKQKKTRLIVLLLVVLLIALAVGYAAFSDTLTITGTATATGKFDMEFTSASKVKSIGCTAGDPQISTDKNTLTVSVTDLAYPGAGAQYHAVITNKGTSPVKVKKVTPTNITGNGNAIKITGLDAITTSHSKIEPNGTCALDFTVEWDKTVADLDTSKNGEGTGDKAQLSFTLEIEYEQDTTTLFDGSAGHTDNNP